MTRDGGDPSIQPSSSPLFGASDPEQCSDGSTLGRPVPLKMKLKPGDVGYFSCLL